MVAARGEPRAWLKMHIGMGDQPGLRSLDAGAWSSRGVPLGVFIRLTARMREDEIAQRLSPMFFLRRGPAASVEGEMPPMQTNPQGGGEVTGDIVVLIQPIRRRADSQHRFVSIGRLDGNDIALPDATVSKFHAYVNIHGDELLLQDAKSRNGTKVDGVAVAPRGAGPPTKLQDGQHIEIGSVALSCVAVRSLLEMARSLSGF